MHHQTSRLLDLCPYLSWGIAGPQDHWTSPLPGLDSLSSWAELTLDLFVELAETCFAWVFPFCMPAPVPFPSLCDFLQDFGSISPPRIGFFVILTCDQVWAFYQQDRHSILTLSPSDQTSSSPSTDVLWDLKTAGFLHAWDWTFCHPGLNWLWTFCQVGQDSFCLSPPLPYASASALFFATFFKTLDWLSPLGSDSLLSWFQLFVKLALTWTFCQQCWHSGHSPDSAIFATYGMYINLCSFENTLNICSLKTNRQASQQVWALFHSSCSPLSLLFFAVLKVC